jgi:hypothetical protein
MEYTDHNGFDEIWLRFNVEVIGNIYENPKTSGD